FSGVSMQTVRGWWLALPGIRAWVLGLPGTGQRSVSLNRVREMCLMNLFSKLWADDAGVGTIEYLVLGTFLALTLILGVATLDQAINVELAQLANAIMTFNQGYSVTGHSNCAAAKTGSAATDSIGVTSFVATAPVSGTVDVGFCP